MDKRDKLAVILTVLVESLIYRAISKEIYLGVKGKKTEQVQAVIICDEIFKQGGKSNCPSEEPLKNPSSVKKRRLAESSEKIVPIFSTDETLARSLKVVEIKESKD